MFHYPKTFIRPVREGDLPDLVNLAKLSGPGMTNLPPDELALEEKILTSLHSFSSLKDSSELMGYFFVLEDIDSGKIVGCSGITAAGTMMMPFYHFKMSTVKYVNHDYQLSKTHKILSMVNDYQGCTEICSLFLMPDFRQGHNGSLLSRARFLFMAEFAERFHSTIIAEMRGVMNDDGSQPFWDHVISKFIDMSFIDADKLTGIGDKQFISDLMPRYPLYVECLHPDAQAVIDKVHEDTEPALALLKKEGFKSHGYIDIFEAGTMVESELEQIETVRHSCKATINDIIFSIDDKNSNDKDLLYLISNDNLDFRACVAALIKVPDTEQIMITEKVAQALAVSKNDSVRIVPLKLKAKELNGSNGKL